MQSKIFTIWAGLSLLGFAMHEGRAEPVTFDFTATVTVSENTSHFTGGIIPVSSALTGSYTFDSEAPDQVPSPIRGYYIHELPLYGITVQAGSNVFKTDPSDVQLWIVLDDGTSLGGGVPDTYDVQSLYNLWPLPPGTEVAFGSLIRMQMVDTEDFIFGDELPLLPPQPTLPPVLIMHVDPEDFSFPTVRVEATIDSLTLRPTTVESTIQDLKDFCAGLPTGSFKGENMQDAFGHKIDSALAQLALIEAETDPGRKAMLIAELGNKLTNDILAKSNGCGTAADKNDWITDCPTQVSVQVLVGQILDLLEAL